MQQNRPKKIIIAICFLAAIGAAYSVWSPKNNPKQPSSQNSLPNRTDETSRLSKIKSNPSPNNIIADSAIISQSHKQTADCGYLKPGKKYTISFTIKNPTNKAIELKKIRSTCKCTKINKPTKTLPAKSETTYQIDFDTPKKPTQYSSKMIFMPTSGAPPVLLNIKADVGRPLKANPEVLNLGQLKPNSTHDFYVTIQNRGIKSVKPVFATCSDNSCFLKISGNEISANDSLKIPAQLKTDNKPGQHKATITISTNCTKQQTVKAIVMYKIEKN